MNEYKQMIYDKNQYDSVVLAQDFYKGYEFFIISLGKHPCAYVRLKQRKYDNYNDYSDKIDVHYGFTYLRTILYLGNHKNIYDEHGFLGWDYGHCTDYEAYYDDNEYLGLNSKKWTTEEIVEECKNVINQLIEIEKK